MEDTKGKGIIYEDDDEPIMLEEQDDSHTIRKFRMSLIGKVLILKIRMLRNCYNLCPLNGKWKIVSLQIILVMGSFCLISHQRMTFKKF